MKKQRNIQKLQPQLHSSFGGLKSVPVIVMLAMNPALLNSDAVAKTIQMDSENPIEVVYNLSTEAPEAPQQAQRGGFVRPETNYVRPEVRQFAMDFKAEGKNWTMYYVDEAKKIHDNKNYVTDIYLVPQDYEPRVVIKSDLNCPPKVQKIVYHDIGANEFIGVVVTDFKFVNGRKITTTREMRVPDEVGNELTALISSETNLKPYSKFVNNFEIVKSADLLPKVEK